MHPAARSRDKDVPPILAETIKQWRETRTWQAVAAECNEKYMSSWGIGWTMPDHQHVGALICEAAARRLNEDPGGEAWNS
jgi:hypothetical protein